MDIEINTISNNMVSVYFREGKLYINDYIAQLECKSDIMRVSIAK